MVVMRPELSVNVREEGVSVGVRSRQRTPPLCEGVQKALCLRMHTHTYTHCHAQRQWAQAVCAQAQPHASAEGTGGARAECEGGIR